MKYGRYEVKAELGTGATSIVYQAHDPYMDNWVALKVLQGEKDEDSVKRFINQARAISRLSHQNIVRIYNVDQDHGTIYIAMEFLYGDSLSDVIKDGSLDIVRIIDVGVQIAKGLDYAHSKNIIHRDIKPSNIILTPEGRAVITDFGVARIEDASAIVQTQTGVIIGTPMYMSPEQVKGKHLDGRTDLYSLGAILYELSTSKPPFTGKSFTDVFEAIIQNKPVNPGKLNSSIPGSLSQVILKSLSKAPDKRFQTGIEMSEKLKTCLESAPRETHFQITKKSFDELRTHRVPEDILKALEDIEDQEIVGKSTFINHLKRTIGKEETTTYKALILIHAEQKTKKRKGLAISLAAIFLLIISTGAYFLIEKSKEDGTVKEQTTIEHTVPREPKTQDTRPLLASTIIKTDPPGADVFINGSLKGKTPTTIELPYGTYDMVLNKQGFLEVIEKNVELKEKEKHFVYKLAPVPEKKEPPTLQSVTRFETEPPGARVFINNTLKGTTPIELKLPRSTYMMIIKLDGYYPMEGTIELKEEKEYFVYDLVPAEE